MIALHTLNCFGTDFSQSRAVAKVKFYICRRPKKQYQKFINSEAGGFEPPIPLRVYRISSAAHSTTLTRLQRADCALFRRFRQLLCPRVVSNDHKQVRNPPVYPLLYGGVEQVGLLGY